MKSPAPLDHAEFIKLGASRVLGRAFDRPEVVWRRCGGEVPAVKWCAWRFSQRRATIERGAVLRIEVRSPATVRYTTDGWNTQCDVATRDTGLGIHLVDIPTHELAEGSAITFTYYWPAVDRWESRNFDVLVAPVRP